MKTTTDTALYIQQVTPRLATEIVSNSQSDVAARAYKVLYSSLKLCPVRQMKSMSIPEIQPSDRPKLWNPTVSGASYDEEHT